MPELPEVETTRRGLLPHLPGKVVSALVVRQPRLRWPVTPGLELSLPGQTLLDIARRGKYLLLRFAHGSLILHLGMSGSLRVLPADTPAGPHDHVDLVFGDKLLRLRDPRRFGAVLWTSEPVEQHALLKHLGPEPLEPGFDGDYLYRKSRGRQQAVKNFIMDGKVVVGVGNIYASEALFLAGISPLRKAGSISAARYLKLAELIREVLSRAIQQGGTTLQDFAQVDGNPGYFSQQLNVYGRAGENCPQCGHSIKCVTLGQRSSFYCSKCQT